MRVCTVSHRFGGFDGVAVEASKWDRAYARLGWSVTHAAGRFDNPVNPDTDTVVAGLWADIRGGVPPKPDYALIDELVGTHDLLVLENVGCYPSAALAAHAFEEAALRQGISTIVRHHDPAWQVTSWPAATSDCFPLHNPAMLHLTINRMTEDQFRRRYPDLDTREAIDTDHPMVDFAATTRGDRDGTRSRLGVHRDDILLAHPARNAARKNIPAALDLAANLATRTTRRVHYWLTSAQGPIGPTPPEVRVHRGNVANVADLYAAADFIVFPSLWEGWGLPVMESATARKLIATPPFPALAEIHALGITTIDHRDHDAIMRLIDDPTRYRELTDSNHHSARVLDISRLPDNVAAHARRAWELMAA